MKNVTVSVPDDVYRKARIRAAEEGRSLSALVSDFLRSLSENDAEFDRLLALQEQVFAIGSGISVSDRLSRDEMHDRAALR